ncbi:MAG: MFS transporter [Candidatus Woesearchaeota archaeon]
MSHNPHAHRHFHLGIRKFPKNISKLPKAIKKISLIFLVYMFGWGIVIPFQSIYIKEILGSYSSLGIITFLLYVTSTLWCIPLGAFMEKVSKKWTLVAIFFFYMFMGPWFLILSGFLSVLFFRMYHGVLMSSVWTTAESFMREHSSKNKTSESIGFFDSSFGLGIVLGCVAGGFLMSMIGNMMYLSVTAFALLALILAILFLPELKKRPYFFRGIKAVFRKGSLLSGYGEVKKDKELVKLLAITFLLVMAAGIVTLLLPLFVYEMGSNYIFIGLIVAASNLPRVFESFFSRIADKNSKRSMILIGSTYSISFFLLVFFTKSITVLFILAFFISLSFSIIRPSIEGAMTTIIPRKKISRISGVISTIKMTAEGMGPLIGGFISDIFGVKYVFLLGAFIMLLLFIFSLSIQSYSNKVVASNVPVVAQK